MLQAKERANKKQVLIRKEFQKFLDGKLLNLEKELLTQYLEFEKESSISSGIFISLIIIILILDIIIIFC